MALEARDWIELHELLKPTLGEQGTGKLMAFLATFAADGASRDDLAGTEARLRVDIAASEARLRNEFADLKGDFADLRSDFAGMEGRVIRWVAGIAVTSVAASAGIAAAVASVLAG
jgi:hypothetical protein